MNQFNVGSAANVRFQFEKVIDTAKARGLDEFVPDFAKEHMKEKREKVIVCRHWLKGLCQKGNFCEFLHRFDRNRMPECKNSNKCLIKDCIFSHPGRKRKVLCEHFNQGYCARGDACEYVHVVRPASSVPPVALWTPQEKAVEMKSRGGLLDPNEMFKSQLCKHYMRNKSCPFGALCHFAHGKDQLKNAPQAIERREKLRFGDEGTESGIAVDDGVVKDQDGLLSYLPDRQGVASYFVLHIPNFDNFAISVKTSMFAADAHLARTLNEAEFHPGEGFGPQSACLFPFVIEWLRLADLQWGKTQNLFNCNSGYKSVNMSHHGQELSLDLGRAMLELFYFYKKEKLDLTNVPTKFVSGDPPVEHGPFRRYWNMHRRAGPSGLGLVAVVFGTDHLREILELNTLGVPHAAVANLGFVQNGTPLMFFDVKNRVLHGLFEVSGQWKYNRHPNAFKKIAEAERMYKKKLTSSNSGNNKADVTNNKAEDGVSPMQEETKTPNPTQKDDSGISPMPGQVPIISVLSCSLTEVEMELLLPSPEYWPQPRSETVPFNVDVMETLAVGMTEKIGGMDLVDGKLAEAMNKGLSKDGAFLPGDYKVDLPGVEEYMKVKEFQFKDRFIGKWGHYMKTIERLTGTILIIRGRGSGNIELDTKQEMDEPLHVMVSARRAQDLNEAKTMLLDRLKGIAFEFESF
eukprot:g2623.t1